MSQKSNIQKKLQQLAEQVAWFESDEFELEAAIEKYKTAETLAGDIEKDLSELKNEITVLKTKFDG
jgi:exonuclease VII small subunit